MKIKLIRLFFTNSLTAIFMLTACHLHAQYEVEGVGIAGSLHTIVPPFDTSSALPLLFLRNDTAIFKVDSAFVVNPRRMRFYNRLHGFFLQKKDNTDDLLAVYQKMTKEDEQVILAMNSQFNAMQKATQQHLKNSNLQLSSMNRELSYIYEQNETLQTQLKETKQIIKKNRKNQFWKSVGNGLVWGGIGGLVGFFVLK